MFTDPLQNAAAHSGSCAMAARASGDLKTANEMQAFSMGAGVAGYRIHHFSVIWAHGTYIHASII